MIARNLLDPTIPPLKWTDNSRKALTWMGEFHVQHLPVVRTREYIGLIAEYDILDFADLEKPFSHMERHFSRPFAHAYDHIYEVVKRLIVQRVSVLPVLDEDDNYMGVVTTTRLLSFFAQSNAMQEPGGIVVLEMKDNQYSLAEIARLVEGNQTKILSSYITPLPHTAQMEVTLKLNRTNLTSVISTFERFGYEVKAAYQEEDYTQHLQSRYDAFMHYLNM